jgi:hypothetical protein
LRSSVAPADVPEPSSAPQNGQNEKSPCTSLEQSGHVATLRV